MFLRRLRAFNFKNLPNEYVSKPNIYFLTKGMWIVRAPVFVDIQCCFSAASFSNGKLKHSPVKPKKIKDLTSEIIETDNLTSSDWAKLKGEIMKLCFGVDGVNVNALMIQDFIRQKNFVQAKKFVKYLAESGEKLNLGAVGKVLMLYWAIGNDTGITEEEKTLILDMYKDIRLKYSILDPITAENCILALSFTKEWRESLNLLDNIKAVHSISGPAYGSIIRAAFSNNDFDTGWGFMNEMIAENRIPPNYVYLSFINYSVRKYKQSKKKMLDSLEKLFNYWRCNGICISYDIAVCLNDVFIKELKWSVSFTTVNNMESCSGCKKKFEEIKLSTEEYTELREIFYKKVMVGKDAFIKTTPKELEHFLNFVDKTAPYDMVIDGLNVAYSIPKEKSPIGMSDLLVNVVKKVLSENKKVLVLGRKHMNSWPKHNLNFLHKNTLFFTTDDLSYDDPFLLYASLNSPHTNFLSRDLMRGHKFLLGEERLKVNFKKWQQGHQHSLIFANKTDVFIQKPQGYLSSAQKNIGWHIPYNVNQINNNNQPPETIEPSKNWLCLQPPRSASTTVKKTKIKINKETLD